MTTSADAAWLLTALAVVLIMFPGIALFYGGMVGQKNVLNMFMMTMSTLATVTVLYVLFGHGLVVGDSVGGWGIIGNPVDWLGAHGHLSDPGKGQVSDMYWLGFFILFAAITVSIVASGAVGRMKFSAWLVFSMIWATLVYFPLAHWVFAWDTDTTVGGWMRNKLELHDYAGGTAVHMASGMAALALAKVLGPRQNTHMRPHNLPIVLVGVGFLWIGWLGFNGGSSGGAGFLAQYAVVNTMLAGCTGMIGFTAVEWFRDGQPTSLGMASGIIAGMVGITPSADAVDVIGAMVVGIAAGALVAWACTWKVKLGVDETLDAFAVHGVGGIAGTACVVLIGWSGSPAGIKGILFGGGWDIVWREGVAIIATCAYSLVMTWLIAKALDRTMGLRVDEDDESEGLDITLHRESGYELDGAGR